MLQINAGNATNSCYVWQKRHKGSGTMTEWFNMVTNSDLV